MSAVDTQRRLVFHGAVILLVGLACGLPAVIEVSSGSSRLWKGGHSALLILGVWLFATAAILPLLDLPEREAAGLRIATPLMAYSFMTAVLIQAITGVRALGPDDSVLGMIAFVAQATPPIMALQGSRGAAIGNNPLAFASPANVLSVFSSVIVSAPTRSRCRPKRGSAATRCVRAASPS